MIQFRHKYKQIFSAILLGIYLLVNFTMPIFEGIHFVLHIGDDTTLHSFQSHNSEHHHLTLTLLEDLDISNNKPTEQPTEVKIKKLLQINPPINKNQSLLKNSISIAFHFESMHYSSPFLTLIVPPPEV